MTGGVERAGAGSAREFPVEWGHPVGSRFSAERAGWVRAMVNRHMSTRGLRELAKRDEKLLATLRQAWLERRGLPVMTRGQEDRAVAVLLRLAPHVEEERCAAYPSASERSAMRSEGDREALVIANNHGVDGSRLRAYDSLARSRGVGLDVVLRAALRGALRDVVLMPPVKPPTAA